MWACFLFILSSYLVNFGNSLFVREKNVIVLSTPSVWDVHYHTHFYDLIKFQLSFAKSIMGHDQVLILTDKHTTPFLTGRSHSVRQKINKEHIIQANIYDIFLRRLAPIFFRNKSLKFDCRYRNIDYFADRQIQGSMKRFLDKNNITSDMFEEKVVLCGDDVVENGLNMAIINKQVVKDSKKRAADWATMIKLFSIFKRVLMVEPSWLGKNKMENMFSFVEDQLIVMSKVKEKPSIKKSDQFSARMKRKVKEKFGRDVKVIEIPVHETEGTCGMYSTLLATDRYVYVPAYGSDPENWRLGYSSLTDRLVQKLIQVNTNKTVVPVRIPNAICRFGASLKSLAWLAKGNIAHKLTNTAEREARKRYYRTRYLST